MNKIVGPTEADKLHDALGLDGPSPTERINGMVDELTEWKSRKLLAGMPPAEIYLALRLLIRTMDGTTEESV